MFKFVANMHGNEAVGHAMVVTLASHILENYGKDERITALVNGTDLWLMPSLNPDGFEAAEEGKCYQVRTTSIRHQHSVGRDVGFFFRWPAAAGGAPTPTAKTSTETFPTSSRTRQIARHCSGGESRRLWLP